jgi:hypothetical protein
MSTVIVRNQAEWDALPASYEEYTEIEIRVEGWLTVLKTPESSHVVARESSHVVAWESSHVEARESSHVEAWESSHVEARESSHVEAWGSSHVEARGSSHVVARESSHVVARESSHVEAWESSHVVAWGSSHVVARESSHVVAWESSHVVARESSHVEARESSHVEAWGSSHVEARGSSHVEAWGSSHVEARGSSHVEARGECSTHHRSSKAPELHGQSSCYQYAGYPMPLSKSDRCTVIPVRKLTGTGGWLEENSATEEGGSVILFKRVSKDWQTQEGTPNETLWPLGSVVTHPSWSPLSGECGPGKFHACSRPYFCDEFRFVVGDRYIAIRVKLEDLHAWDGGDYPHKIAFRSCEVLHECDRYGVKL